MGVVNVTDDSFSDGGLFLDRDRAVAHGLALAAEGAAIVDVGGESTRPGATRIDPEVETSRVVPVIKELAGQGLTVSIDTMHAAVAQAALENGAQIVNDVSGGRADPDMAPLLADAKVPWVLMHWRSVGAARPHDAPAYGDVVAEVRDELMASVDAAVAAGVDPVNVIIDPGLGFAKTAEHNWAILRALPEFVSTGVPVLVGASRKRFLGTLLAGHGRRTASARRQGDRDRGDLRARRTARRVGCAGARRAGVGGCDQSARGVVRRAGATPEGQGRAVGPRAQRRGRPGDQQWLIESNCAG